jgi:carbamoyltransferase
MTDFYEYLAKSAIGERFDNVAAALQFTTEQLTIQWIKNAIKKTGIKNIYTGGGVFMNVKLNKKIQEIKEIDHVAFMPSCGDESLPIGALYHYAKSRGIKTYPFQDLYLGISYTDDEIHNFLKKNRYSNKYKIKKHNDIDHSLAKLLSKGDVVARFSWRCEWGARSLGNRAILAHPSFMESFYMVNDQIKSRDFWMPFAPSMLDSFASHYLENYSSKKNEPLYMITAFDAKPKAIKDLKATIHHGDHTLRPQIVTKKSNPSYYRLIKEFSRLTGVGALLNTSMNLHGYPLVCSPEQALFTFENSNLKHLALGSYLISKNQ